MSKSTRPLGEFRITHTDQWDQDFVDAEVEGFIHFEKGGTGEFHFGYVSGSMDCRPAEREGKPGIEWSWDGNDEMEGVSGRGWAILEPDGSIRGEIFIHGGDSSEFTAVKKVQENKIQRPKRK
jgi:hypothetical protein